MSRITLYISRQILTATVLTTVVLCILMMLIQSVRLVEMIVNNGLAFLDVLELSLLAAPRYLVFLLPVVLFGATMFIYNRMAADREMVAMRAAGTNQTRLARPAILMGLLVAIVCYGLTLYIMPLAQQTMQKTLLQARAHWSAALIQEKQFINIGDKATIYIKERRSSGDLLNIFYHDSEKKLTLIAERGAIVNSENGPRILALNGSKQYLRKDGPQILHFERAVVDLNIPEVGDLSRWAKPHERFLPELLFPDPSNTTDMARRGLLMAEVHNRLVSPFMCLTLTFIALTATLTGGFSRHQRTRRLFIASGIMFAIYVFHVWLANMGEGSLPTTVLLYANALLPALVCYGVLVRQDQDRPPQTVPSVSTTA